MVEQFFTDLAADSGHVGPAASNEFSVLPQYGQGQTISTVTPGSYTLKYDSGNSKDLILDSHPYPARRDQCASPAGIATCLTDGQIQSEVHYQKLAKRTDLAPLQR